MSKKRLYEVAREVNLSSEALVKMVRKLGYNVKSHMSVATEDMLNGIKIEFERQKRDLRDEMVQKERKSRERKARERQKRSAPRPGPSSTPPGSAPTPPDTRSRQFQGPPGSRAGGSAPRGRSDRRGGGGGGGRPGPSRKRRKRGGSRFGPREIDHREVEASFRRTIANIGSHTRKRRSRRGSGEEAEVAEPTRAIEVNEFMSIAELASKLGIKPAELVAKCLELGMIATVNQRIDIETIETLALEYDYSIIPVADVGADLLEEDKEESSSDLQLRPPVVTIMGHVDHGKTSLLDFIRESHIVAGESGGITQHIGAYSVQVGDGRVTFLDTPGHEAFTAMRARGAQITDIVILVVAADDSVMPQTKEAIDHAKAASVPIVVAINKMDLPGANADRVMGELSKYGLLAEVLGGKTAVVPISAKTGMNVDKLLEQVMLQAEIMELKANPERLAKGIIIESRLDKGRGPLCTVLVQAGTLRQGDFFVTGSESGRVRTMVDERMRDIEEAGPSTPVQVTGMSGVPQAGDQFAVTADEQMAREIAHKRGRLKREYSFHRLRKISLANVHEQIKEGQLRELKIVIKADVDGSVEVLADTLSRTMSDEVAVNIIHRGVGAITESDVLLAAASDAVIIGFHVRPDVRSKELANREGVDIRTYNIIYEVQNDIRAALEGMLSPEESEESGGTAMVKETFRISRVGTVAGCEVKSGTIRSGDSVRLLRDGVIVYSGEMESLKRFTDDAREVSEGMECGIKIANYDDVKVGDTIESFRVVSVARKLV